MRLYTSQLEKLSFGLSIFQAIFQAIFQEGVERTLVNEQIGDPFLEDG